MTPEVPIEPQLEGERRWATVLFGDLVGFTQMSEAKDPEELRLIVDHCTGRMGEIVDRYGGWIDKVIGDALMAVFGAPITHEDDAERAVRAALELQRFASENAQDLGGLALRVGVDSGEVMFAPVGPAGSRELTVMGDTVNTAWRLQEAAPEGRVLIGEGTKCACEAAISCEAIGPVSVKGKETPLAAWLASEAFTTSRPEVVPTGPILGREAELDLLRRTWDRVVALKQPQLVSVLGSPGVGKTRLCRELAGHVEDQGGQVVGGRSLPYGEKTGYGGLAQMIRGLAGILETDSPDQARSKLEDQTEGLIAGEKRDRVLAHISVLAGFTEETVGQRSELFISVQEFVEATARQRPTLFVFEDIHWADPSLLDLIEWMAAHVREVPAMILTLARGELLDARPSWGGGVPRHTGISLEPLSPDRAHELALRLLRDASQPEDAAERIEQSAGGNPLFIEELVAATAEGTTESALELPVAVRAIIAARLDALPAEERSLILDAAVAGNVFTRGVIECLADARLQVTEALEDLQFRDLIRRRRVSRTHGDEEFSFKHNLIREVAYGTLPHAARRRRHAVVAEFLEEAAPSGANAAAILAHHWREAGDSERAVQHLLLAAELAGRGWAKGEAVALYNEALELIPQDAVGRRREVELRRAIDYAAFTHIGDARQARRKQQSDLSR
jgi:class 3 adenylate cyclase/energy-coupling factor transporter ATP-binding protein EcfA2